MKSALIMAAAAGYAFAHPGMNMMMQDLAKRQGPPAQVVPLIGDLNPDFNGGKGGATTTVGKEVLTCLNDASGKSCDFPGAKTYTRPSNNVNSRACKADTCCVWDFVAQDLIKLFTNIKDSTCNDLARASIRLGFHDAAAWDQTTPGGADGSLILDPTESLRSENNGLQTIVAQANTILAKYDDRVQAADLAQFMHNVAVVTCPLGPRSLTLVGRKSSAGPAPTGLLPDTHSSVDVLLQLFLDKTIGTVDLISLIGAHTTAQQRFVDPSKPGPLDTTDGVWDVEFYTEALQPAPQPGTFRLPSDDAFSKDNRSIHGFEAFADPTTGQATWNAFYAKGYTRLSLLGVDIINELTDCTGVLPDSKPVFPVPAVSSSSVIASSTKTSSVIASSTKTSSVKASSTKTSSTKTSSTGYGGKGEKISSVYAHPTVVSSKKAPHYTTSTVYSTSTHTISECASTVTDCPYKAHPTVVTSVVAVSTTVCPVEDEDEAYPTYSSSVEVKPIKHVSYAPSSSVEVKPVVTAKPSWKAPACNTVYTTTTVWV